MTIAGWFLFGFLALIVIISGAMITIPCFEWDHPWLGVLTIIITCALLIGMLLGFRWYFNNTASGQRALVDQKSELNNGVERVVNVYTANGDLIAQYSGLIDIDTNDGGYVKFDFEGKRYIYYNCFVETIAEIS
jgi:hypothetical protein